jgi:hypothetical protein
MKTLFLTLLFAAGLCHAAPLVPDSYRFSYDGTQESNSLHAIVSGGFTFDVPSTQTTIGLADLTSFSMNTLETTTLFGFTETTSQSDLADVTAFSFDVPSNTISMSVKLFDGADTHDIFSNLHVIPDFDNTSQTVGFIGLAIGPFSLTAAPEPASWILMGLGMVAGAFVMRWNKRSENN